jgi:uncharacterized damage-inducible protein DinB
MYNIQRHLAYNYWANNKIAHLLKTVSSEVIDKETPGSFNTLKKTIYHIWDAEVIWFTRIKGLQVTHWPSENFQGTFAEALELFVQNSKELCEFIQTKERDFLDTVIRYKNLKGVEYAQPVEEILFHVVNHGSFHRGQIITMLRALDQVELVNTDLITYLRLQ